MDTMIDTTPKPSFLRAMQNQKWNVSGALSEFIDNSFGLGRGAAQRVHIYHDTTNRILSVLDDGRGMDQVARLFQLGNTIGRTPGDIGLYGSGGTFGILWLPDTVEVQTLRGGQVSSFSMNWAKQFAADHFFPVPDRWVPFDPKRHCTTLGKWGHGTRILLHLLKGRSFHASNVIRDLSQTFAPAIRHGKEIQWITVRNGRVHEARSVTDPFEMPSDPTRRVSFDLTIEFEGDLLPVHGYVGIVPGLSHAQSTIAVGYGHRNIMSTRDCYQSPDGAQRYAGTGVTGWLELGEGWQSYFAVTKDAITDDRLWARLMSYIFERIEHLLKQTEDDQVDLILDDIALDLARALDAQIPVRVSQPGEHHTGSCGDGTGVSVTPSGKSTPAVPSDKDHPEVEVEDVGRAHLTIHRQTDEGCDGRLCFVEINGLGGVSAYVNRDHECVQEALKAKPINRMALSYMVVRELATQIKADQELLRRVFRPQIVQLVHSRTAEVQEGFVTRLLMDRVRTPANGAKAAA